MPDTWYKVDNVAKVFLASVTRRDPRVFRVSCTLSEPVDPGLLDAALARTAREYPQFQVTLHRGLFWHYLESSDKHPRAVPETLPPCAAIYGRELKNDLLYRVSYYHDRINVVSVECVLCFFSRINIAVTNDGNVNLWMGFDFSNDVPIGFICVHLRTSATMNGEGLDATVLQL